MAARITLERILRDDNDDSGQTIRDWKIESEGGHVTIRMKHGDGFIVMRPEDVGVFTRDLDRAAALARELAQEAKARSR